MLKIVSCNSQNYKKKLGKYIDNDVLKSKARIDIVRKIIDEVKNGGNKKLIYLTNKYDNNNFKNIKERYL